MMTKTQWLKWAAAHPDRIQALQEIGALCLERTTMANDLTINNKRCEALIDQLVEEEYCHPLEKKQKGTR